MGEYAIKSWSFVLAILNEFMNCVGPILFYFMLSYGQYGKLRKIND